jgi:hypothetical protein
VSLTSVSESLCPDTILTGHFHSEKIYFSQNFSSGRNLSRLDYHCYVNLVTSQRSHCLLCCQQSTAVQWLSLRKPIVLFLQVSFPRLLALFVPIHQDLFICFDGCIQHVIERSSRCLNPKALTSGEHANCHIITTLNSTNGLLVYSSIASWVP